LPLGFNIENKLLRNFDSHHFFGIAGVYFPNPPSVYTGVKKINSNSFFKKYNISINTGLGVMLCEQIRLDLAISVFVLPLLKSNYYTEFQDVSDYFGTFLLPIELNISIEILFKN
jgi:hypothetical protein